MKTTFAKLELCGQFIDSCGNTWIKIEMQNNGNMIWNAVDNRGRKSLFNSHDRVWVR